MPAVTPLQLAGKRALGYLNWHRRRKSFHLRSVADLLVEDVKNQKPDHIAVTGDLVNLSLRAEFDQALAWLETIGTGDDVSVVPGNHDAYVRLPWGAAIGKWRDYMCCDTAGSRHVSGDPAFPFVRIVGEMAVIGLSTAIPTPPFFAYGTLGPAQLQHLEHILLSLEQTGLYRVILIHHPPLTHQASRRKRLSDSNALTNLLEKHGADLVLHGHNHRDMYETLPGRQGLTHIFGVPSASGTHHGYRPAAQYNLYEIQRLGGEWRCSLTIRGLTRDGTSFEPIKELIVSP